MTKRTDHSDQILNKAWSDIQGDDFVRWATPRFIKYGKVLRREGDSMTVKFVEDSSPRAIPHAKWYYAQGKLNPNGEEHLVVIDYKAWYGGVAEVVKPARRPHTAWITVQAACEMLNMDPKQLRRHLRRGVIPATKNEDRWYVDGDRLREIAAKNGWI